MLWVRGGHSNINRDMVHRLVRDQRKAVLPLQHIDRCLLVPIADWNDPMSSTKEIDPIMGPEDTIKTENKTIKYEKELKELTLRQAHAP